MASPPADPARRDLRRRLRSLAVMEAVNVPLQAFVWFGLLGFPASAPNLAGFVLLALVLLEGTGYWRAKLLQVTARRRDLPAARWFRFARTANLALLGVGVGLTGWAVVAEPGRATTLGLGFALFAGLEHLNYFHIQLMHDTRNDVRRLLSGGPRRSHLARDLDLDLFRSASTERESRAARSP